MTLLYVRTSKTASSTVNDWCGINIASTHNRFFLTAQDNKHMIEEFLKKDSHLFTTVRNPFTRAISQWQQSIKSLWIPKETTFEEYMEWDYTKVNEHCYTHNCTLVEYLSPYLNKIKTIMKAENLEEPIRKIEKEFSLPERRIGFFNKADYRDDFDYNQFYNDSRIEMVLDKYSSDFDTFNYSKSIVNI